MGFQRLNYNLEMDLGRSIPHIEWIYYLHRTTSTHLRTALSLWLLNCTSTLSLKGLDVSLEK